MDKHSTLDGSKIYCGMNFNSKSLSCTNVLQLSTNYIRIQSYLGSIFLFFNKN